MAIRPEVSVVQLVRAAKVVAMKLGLGDASDWINRELNGYDDLSLLPKYRVLTGECQAFNPFRGWIPVQFPTAEFHDLCSKAHVAQSLGSMEPLLNDGSDHATLPFRFGQQRILQEMFQEDMKFAIRLSKGHLNGIFDAVRNLALDWSLSLEQAGIRGESMSFTLAEKQEAKPVSQQFFIQNAGVIGNVSDSATVTNNQQVTGSLSIDGVRDLVKQAKASLSAIPLDTRQQVAPLLDEIEQEACSTQPNQGKVRTALASLKTICEGAAGNLLASGIAAGVASLLK